MNTGIIYKYGMRLRGFSIGCQPMKNFAFVDNDDVDKKYHSILYYIEKLTDKEVSNYDLDFLGDVDRFDEVCKINQRRYPPK